MEAVNQMCTSIKAMWTRREVVWQLARKISLPFCVFYIFVIVFVALFTRYGFQNEVKTKISDLYKVGA